MRFNAAYLGKRLEGSEQLPVNGFGPIALGVKIKLFDEQGFLPQAAIASHINLTAGTPEFIPDYTASDITLLFSHQFNKSWSLTYNGGVKWSGDTPEAIFIYTLSVGYVIERFEFFAETYSFFPEVHKADHRMDTGLIFTLTPTLQVDVAGGVGLSNNAPDYFITTGISVRFLK